MSRAEVESFGSPMSLPPRDVVENEPTTTVVQPIIAVVGPSEPTPEQYLRAIESAGAFDFWNDPAEDLYGSADQ